MTTIGLLIFALGLIALVSSVLALLACNQAVTDYGKTRHADVWPGELHELLDREHEWSRLVIYSASAMFVGSLVTMFGVVQ